MIGFVAILLTQYTYDETLFKWSLIQIPALQKNVSQNEWSFWHHFTNIGGGALQTIYLLLNVVFNPTRIETMILVINLSIEMVVTHLFKVWHH